jgi:TIGR03009 family protein
MLNRLGCWIALLFALTVVSFATPLAAQSTPAAQPMPPEAASTPNNGASNGVLANGAPAQPQQISVQPPFVLAPQQQASLDQLLTEWESKSNAIKTFKCSFTRLEYDPAFIADPKQPKTECHGELKYAAPDKGLFHVTAATEFVADPASKSYKAVQVEPTEYWTCNGKSMFQVDAKKKQIIEQPIPPEMQGKSITEGPLPFVFGAKADVLKKRYFMRVITPDERSKDEVWLEALPKSQKDAANFSRVELILSKPDLQPVAIQIYNPGAGPQNQSRTVIKLENPSVNNPWLPIQQLFNDFAQPNMIGYKHVVEQPQVPPPASPQIPTGSAADQASRTKSLHR